MIFNPFDPSQDIIFSGNNTFSGQNTFTNATFGAKFNDNIKAQFGTAGVWDITSDGTHLIFNRASGTGGCKFNQNTGFVGTTPVATVGMFCTPTSATITQLFNGALTYTGSGGSIRAITFTATAQGTSTAPSPSNIFTATLDSNQAGMTSATMSGLVGIASVLTTRQITQAANIVLNGLQGQIANNGQTHTNATFFKTSVVAVTPPAFTMGAGASQIDWAFRCEGDGQVHDDKLWIFGGSSATKATNSMSWVSASSVLRTQIGGATFWDLSSTTHTYADGKNIAFGTTTGTKIGTGTTQKIGFHNAAPVVQDTGWGSITNVTTDRAYDANATTVDELADVLGTLIAQLINKGLIGS